MLGAILWIILHWLQRFAGTAHKAIVGHVLHHRSCKANLAGVIGLHALNGVQPCLTSVQSLAELVSC